MQIIDILLHTELSQEDIDQELDRVIDELTTRGYAKIINHNYCVDGEYDEIDHTTEITTCIVSDVK